MRKLLAAIAAASALLAAGCGEVVGPQRPQSLNHAPVVNVSGPSSSEPGETITIITTASDADGDALAYSWSSSEPTDVLASPAAPTTMVTLGVVESTRTFRVSVSDGDTTVAATLAVLVARDSIPPPPPPTCQRRPVVFLDAATPEHVVADHSLVSLYDAYVGTGIQPVTVAGIALGGGWYQFDLSGYEMYPRLSWHQYVVDWSDPPAVRQAEGCWADVEASVVPADAAFRKRSDPDGWSFEWVPVAQPCVMAPLGSSNWTDDGETVTVTVDHGFWSFYDDYAAELEPAVTLVGTPDGAGRWIFEIPVSLTETHGRSNFHQMTIDWSAPPADRAAMGCWADLLRSVLPPDAPFAIRSDSDGLSLEYVGSDEPAPVDGSLFLDLRGVYYLSNFEFWSFYGAGPLQTVVSTTVLEGLHGFPIAAIDAAASVNPQSNLHTEALYDSPTNVWASLQGDEVWVAPRTHFEVAGDHLERF